MSIFRIPLFSTSAHPLSISPLHPVSKLIDLAMTASNSLGNDAFLSKIDRLRATNVGSLIPLPQVIVVGDQSSGKSSALESLTGFAFPRAATLCTRYATQISCIRAPEKRVVVSIIPRMDASDELKTRLQAFRRQLDTMDDAALAQIFHDVSFYLLILYNSLLFVSLLFSLNICLTL